MQNILELRRRFDHDRRELAFDAVPRFDVEGLMLGRGTRLARERAKKGFGLDAERSAVLLATAYGKLQPSALKHLRRAIGCWQRGDAALAHIELAFARLSRLESEDDAFRLFLAEALLDEGMTPRGLAGQLGIDLEKYDPDERRVPAGSGRESGRWGPGSGSDAGARMKPGIAFIGEDAAETVGRSFLTDASPAIVRALAAFAARFSVPTAVLGALFIPTPNSGGVTQGTLPGAPDISFERDGPAGILRLRQKQADGTETVVAAQSRAGVYVDVATGTPLGRDLGLQLYLDLATVVAALAAGERDRPAATDDQPQLCPAPVRDVDHKAKEHTLDYEDDVHLRVNPLAPIPRGFAVRIVDPDTGEAQYPDDCFRYAGDLVDGDMKPGDFADAKGEEYASLLTNPYFGDQVMDQITDVTERHLRAAKALGANLKVYFAEQSAADLVRAHFATKPAFNGVIVGYLPPSKPKPRGRSR